MPTVPANYHDTKIVATLGPASGDLETVRRLIRAGANCFRINFSHGDGASLEPLIRVVREAARLEQLYIPILADIQGPKLRVGDLPAEGVELLEGRDVTLTSRDIGIGNATLVSTSYEFLARDLTPGGRILLADGVIELSVVEVGETDALCRVVIGGTLFSNKGMNLPGVLLSVRTLTKKDHADLKYIAAGDIDMVAVSFVRSPTDVDEARELLAGGNKIPVMAKLERPEALENLNAILEAADGVMVARGDLGVELEFERLPTLQKQILVRAAERGKWVVVATQMLGSMVKHSRPSRAEVSDVANAVLDGADAVMLSEETAIGRNPITAVEAMVKIAREAENLPDQKFLHFDEDIMSFAAGAAGAAVSAARRLNARAIVTLAGSGLTALLVSKWHPGQFIVALSANERTLRRLNVLRGVHPVAIEGMADMERQIDIADSYLIRNGLARVGDPVIVAAAMPLGSGRETNTVRFHKVRGEGG